MEKLIKSFACAFRGVLCVLKSENNARIHLVVAVIVLLVGWRLELSAVELAMLLMAVAIVLLTEAFNTVAEKILDLIDNSHNPRVARIKDMTAGSVLLAAFIAVGIGGLIFIPYLDKLWAR